MKIDKNHSNKVEGIRVLCTNQGTLILESLLANCAGVLVIAPVRTHLPHMSLENVLVREDARASRTFVPRLIS